MLEKRAKDYRSRNAIKRALIALLQTAPYQSVTTRQIIDLSSYSKGTFYAHFFDKDEVDTYMSCTTQYLAEVQNTRLVSDLVEQIQSGLEKFFQHVYDNQDLYKIIADRKFPGTTLHTLANMLYDATKSVFYVTEDPGSLAEQDLRIYIHTHTHVQVIEYWVKHNFEQSPEFIVTQMQQIMNVNTQLWIRAK